MLVPISILLSNNSKSSSNLSFALIFKNAEPLSYSKYSLSKYEFITLFLFELGFERDVDFIFSYLNLRATLKAKFLSQNFSALLKAEPNVAAYILSLISTYKDAFRLFV